MKICQNSSLFTNPWGDDIPNKAKNQDKPTAKNNNTDLEDLIKKSQEKIFSFLKKSNKGENKKNNDDQNNVKVTAIAIFTTCLFIWLATGFYTIDTDEEGVILRFGKYIRTATPGLNYKLPRPIEVVEKISVTRINKEVIGLKSFATKTYSPTDESDVSNPKESQMLTGDENIIDMHFFVQWYIKNAKDYLFNIKDDIGESTVKVSAESSMRQIIGRVKISEALSEQRQEIEQRVKTLLQGLLDNYNSGVEIVNVGILYSYVAPEVRDAYRDIQSARADKEGEINNAMAYKNDIIPRARGEAQAIIEEAKGYKESVISRAAGEAERFRNIFSQYQNARDITRKRMYIEAMEQVLKDVNKIVIDKSMAGKTLSLLPIQDLIKK
jgi:membrane protease subunit HflK